MSTLLRSFRGVVSDRDRICHSLSFIDVINVNVLEGDDIWQFSDDSTLSMDYLKHWRRHGAAVGGKAQRFGMEVHEGDPKPEKLNLFVLLKIRSLTCITLAERLKLPSELLMTVHTLRCVIA